MEEELAMHTQTHPETQITVGIDTHADQHVTTALDQLGRLLDTHAVASTQAGYAALLGWARGFGTMERIGIEDTGAYRTGLSRWLRARGLVVVEVKCPKRGRQRRRKSNPLDAEATARTIQ